MTFGKPRTIHSTAAATAHKCFDCVEKEAPAAYGAVTISSVNNNIHMQRVQRGTKGSVRARCVFDFLLLFADFKRSRCHRLGSLCHFPLCVVHDDGSIGRACKCLLCSCSQDDFAHLHSLSLVAISGLVLEYIAE